MTAKTVGVTDNSLGTEVFCDHFTYYLMFSFEVIVGEFVLGEPKP